MSRRKMTKEEFQRQFAEIRNKRHKRSVRGTGGAGNMLEHLLGLGIDNKQTADLGFAELKVRMRDVTTSVKLFSLDRDAWQTARNEATEKFGSTSDDDRKRLCLEMRQGTITKTGLKFFGDDESVAILSPNNDIVAEWSLDTLVETFEKKIKELVIVSAEMQMGADGFDYFIYRNAMHLHGFSKKNIRAAFLENIITLDLHIETMTIRDDGSWKMKNRGTSFRINESKLEKLFDQKEPL